MEMIKRDISFLLPEEEEQISQLALFTALYQAVWFLQCNLSASAPYSTLVSFDQMLKFSEFEPHLAFTICDSIINHTWYLSQPWVIASLVDQDCPDEERKAVASRLLATPRPDHFSPGKPALPRDFWPEGGEMPSLANFVGPNSWLLPTLLGLTDENMEWLQLDVGHWELMSSYRRFASLVSNLPVVNDPAERATKLI